MKKTILHSSLLLGAVALATACSTKGEDPDPGHNTGRNFQYNEDGNGELNVLGCKYVPTGSLEDMQYMPHVQTWLFGDLSKLQKVGDEISNVVVLHQAHDPSTPHQLGLAKLEGWKIKFQQDAQGEDVLVVSGLGKKHEGVQPHVSYTVPFWEGLYETKFMEGATEGATPTAEHKMNCEVSFWRR